jgi:2-dehydro-3-deoxygalactonokinase
MVGVEKGIEGRSMIVVDWGTSSFRAFRIADGGAIIDRRSSAQGIMHVPDGCFADTLRGEIGDWLKAGENRVLLAGMIGSRQGWKEAPYVPCPAGAAELSAALVNVPFDGAQVKLVPGMNGFDQSGVAEVMRGEETQIIGALAAIGRDGLACLPGTHSKWVRIENGRIVRFTSHMTGEIFAVLRAHTILGRMMRNGPANNMATDEAFLVGIARAREPGGLLHHVFGVRTQTLTGKLAETEGPSYLSGILIGHELLAELGNAGNQTVHLIGAPELVTLYARAVAACGSKALSHDGDASVRGLAIIGAHTKWH